MSHIRRASSMLVGRPAKHKPPHDLGLSGVQVARQPIHTQLEQSVSCTKPNSISPSAAVSNNSLTHHDTYFGISHIPDSQPIQLKSPPRVLKRAQTISVGITSSNRNELMRTQHMMGSLREFYGTNESKDSNPSPSNSDVEPPISEREMLMRESLRFDKRVLHALRDVWHFLQKQYGPVLLRQHYFDLQARAYAALVESFDVANAAHILQDDWVADSHGLDKMDFALFARAWFQIADRWTDEISAKAYAEFLLSLFNILAPLGSDGLRSFANATSFGGHDGRLPDGSIPVPTRASQLELDRLRMLGLRKHGEMLLGEEWERRMNRFRDLRATMELANFRRSSQLRLINQGLDNEAFRKNLNEVELERESNAKVVAANKSCGGNEQGYCGRSISPMWRMAEQTPKIESGGDLILKGRPQPFLNWRHQYVLDPAVEAAKVRGAATLPNTAHNGHSHKRISRSRRALSRRHRGCYSAKQRSRSQSNCSRGGLIGLISEHRSEDKRTMNGFSSSKPRPATAGKSQCSQRRFDNRSRVCPPNSPKDKFSESELRPRTAPARAQPRTRRRQKTHHDVDTKQKANRPCTAKSEIWYASNYAEASTACDVLGRGNLPRPGSARPRPLPHNTRLGEAILGQRDRCLSLYHGAKPRERTTAHALNAMPPTLTSRVLLSGYVKRPSSLTQGRPATADSGARPSRCRYEMRVAEEDSIAGAEPPFDPDRFMMRQKEGTTLLELGLRRMWETRGGEDAMPKAARREITPTKGLQPLEMVGHGCRKLQKTRRKAAEENAAYEY